MLFTRAIALSSAFFGLVECIPSFAPPSYPPSTIENDGTDVGRYDVRKLTAIVNMDKTWANSYYFLFWLTTVEGKKYHVCVDPILFGNSTTGGVYSLNDLNDPNNITAIGKTSMVSGYGNEEFLNLRSSLHNVTSPQGSDNYSTIAVDTAYGGFGVNVVTHPTGKNMYYGGVGGIVVPGYGSNFTIVPPGWSWYFANPTVTVEGTITVDGETAEIDTAQSFGLLERQYGAFNVRSKGFYIFWAYLPNGIVVQVWVISPAADGTGEGSMATIWHPDGLHEVASVDMSITRAWDESASSTGRLYFNKYCVALTARNISFTFEKPVRDAEVSPDEGQNGLTISETYCEGTAQWDGETLPWFGHCEELSIRTAE